MIVREIKFNSTRKFGIELEFNHPSRHTLKNIVTSAGEPCLISRYMHNYNNNEWYAKTDSSCGYELASRVMSGWSDIIKLGNVIQKLHESRYVRYENNCGMHVHINISDFDLNQLSILLLYWIKCEHIFFNMLPPNRRDNQYCRKNNINEYFNSIDIDLPPDQIVNRWTHRGALSINHVRIGANHSRVEFRLGHMSTDPDYVKAWVRLLIWYVDIIKLLPKPNDLTWISVKRFFRLMGFMNDHNNIIEKRFSHSVNSIRFLILNKLIEYQDINFEKIKEETNSLYDLINQENTILIED